MVSPLLSIVIPTHKRAEILRRCLEHIDAQTVWEQLEVIVVSDGEDSATMAMMASRSGRVPVTFFSIPKSQQGVARNRGVEKARAPVVLFGQDDIFFAPDACEVHLRVRSGKWIVDSGQYGSKDPRMPHFPLSTINYQLPAVLGFTTWDPALEISPVMRWLERNGWQFGYPMLAPYAHAFIPATMQHTVTYTSHISLPTEIAKKFPFREDVSLYGWEDIEWGMRLRDAGVPLFYEPDAKALHHHPMTLEQSLQRMKTLGQSAVLMEKNVPGFDRVPKGWKLFAYRLAGLLPTMAGKHRAAFVRGMRRGSTLSNISAAFNESL